MVGDEEAALLGQKNFFFHPIIFLITAAVGAFSFGTFSLLMCRIDSDDFFDGQEVALRATMLSSQSQQFDPVERSPERLRELAVEFAEKVGLQDRVKGLYEEQKVEDFSTYILRARAAKRKKRLAKNKRAIVKKKLPARRAPQIRRPKEHWEPRFSLPIPRDQFWLSSPFGRRKKANGKWGFHHGVDLAANRGTPIRAAGSGKVIEAGWAKGYGKTVVVRHDERFTTRYAHMDAIGVIVGRQVKEGSVIGRVGATGYVRKTGGDGSHLHFEVRDRGKSCNPFYFLK